MPRVTHFEIHATDPQKVVAFYTAVFGWKFQHMPQMNYWLIDTAHGDEAGINGGLVERRGPPPAEGQAVNAYVCTVNVASFDDYFTKAAKAGATVALPKTAIPNVGWIGYCKDPDGNIFGLHQSDPNAR